MKSIGFSIHQSGQIRTEHVRRCINAMYDSLPEILECYYTENDNIAFDVREGKSEERIMYKPSGWEFFGSGENSHTVSIPEALTAFTTNHLAKWVLSYSSRDSNSGEPCTSAVNNPVSRHSVEMKESLSRLSSSVAARMAQIENRSKFYCDDLYVVIGDFSPQMLGMDYRDIWEMMKRDIRPGSLRSVVRDRVAWMNREFSQYGFIISDYGDKLLVKSDGICVERFPVRCGDGMESILSYRSISTGDDMFLRNIKGSDFKNLTVDDLIHLEPRIASVMIEVLENRRRFHDQVLDTFDSNLPRMEFTS